MKRTNFQTLAIITFAIIILGVAGYLMYRKNHPEMKTYANAQYGITFDYPDSYDLTETAHTQGQPGTLVTLTEHGVSIPSNGEAPTAITIAMYEGTGTTTVGNQDPLLAWIRTSHYSNFTAANQSDPELTTVANKDARLYTWDGLYQGTTVVTLHQGNIIMFTVTYDGETDLKKRQDFTDLIQKVKFLDEGNATSTPSTMTPTSSINAIPKTATLSGVYECLPHSESGNVQTMECAFGIKADNGNHYALSMNDISPGLINTEMNVRIQVTGTLVPIEQISTDMWQKYNIKGIMKVDAFKKL